MGPLSGGGVPEDIATIGHDDHAWFCSENNVYLVFQFDGAPRDSPVQVDDLDTLTEISIVRRLEGCL